MASFFAKPSKYQRFGLGLLLLLFFFASNASTVLGMGTNNDGILSRTYWFAWKSGVALMGIGSVVGRNAVASYDIGGPIVVTSMNTTGLNEIFVPLYYLTGINGISRDRSTQTCIRTEKSRQADGQSINKTYRQRDSLRHTKTDKLRQTDKDIQANRQLKTYR